MGSTAWDTPDALRALLCELVGWDSVTGTSGERAFSGRLAQRLRELPHFAANPQLVEQRPVAAGREFVTALYRGADAVDTIVLISHFDTVDTADYGPLEQHACDPERLTALLHEHHDGDLGAEAAADLASGEYLFGRGTMDMKAGLALHLALLARATAEQWNVNLLLLAVPDEEVNSDGMRAAVGDLVRLRAEHGLEYVLFLNGEPSFPAAPGDDRHHVYSGSIGKLLPSALAYGRETHAGTPLAGITSTYVASFLTRAMEWNDSFRETVHGETTPLPVTLGQRDLRDGYSTQTPFRTSAMYNVFVMERSAAEVLDRFEHVAREAARECSRAYRAVCEREGVEPIGDVRVLRYEQLLAHARESLGSEQADAIAAAGAAGAGDDLREQALAAVDALLVACQELTPAIVVLFAPPFYPAVNSSGDDLVEACVARVREQAASRFGRELHRSHWFNGISDLSYVSHRGDDAAVAAYERNTPGFGERYVIPFAAMRELDAPVLNVGPFGKDPHQHTERLHVGSAFHELPELLADLVQFVAARQA